MPLTPGPMQRERSGVRNALMREVSARGVGAIRLPNATLLASGCYYHPVSSSSGLGGRAEPPCRAFGCGVV